MRRWFTKTAVLLAVLAPAGARAQDAAELLGRLAGAPVTVQLGSYRGDDPWRAQDLVACPGKPVRRFVDVTHAERRQAARKIGPCLYQEGSPGGYGYRATADRHVHADFDKPYGVPPDGTRDFVEKEYGRLTIGLDGLHNHGYFQEDVWTGAGPDGVVGSWRDAFYYARTEDGREIGVGGCMTTTTPALRCDGVQVHVRLAAPSSTGFRFTRAVLDCTAGARACALVLTVAAGGVAVAELVARPGAPARVVLLGAP